MEICGRGYVTGVCGVVPVDGKSAEEGNCPVDGDGVEFLDGLYEVVGVLFSDILDAKVVHDEEENMGLVSCFHSAGVLGIGAKPNLVR